MTQARRTLISLDDTPYYHCIARCVRRAFLCGEDHYSGQSFEHRRQWVVDRLRFLSDIFAIDICAYAILHNHYHIIVRVDVDRALAWDTTTVIQRWCLMFNGNLLSQRFLKGETLSLAEQEALDSCVAKWRERLMSISWFMKELNEFIARKANREDNCKGRFWESRFKSQALLDTTAVLACMAYVDLNPIRAGIAKSVIGSDFTSIQERLFILANKRQARITKSTSQSHSDKQTKLLPFIEAEHETNPACALPFNLKDYCDLVDWTGRCLRGDKRGAISGSTPRLLNQLGLSSQQWRLLSIDIQKQSLAALGSLEQLEIYHASIHKRWMPRQAYLKRCYPQRA